MPVKLLLFTVDVTADRTSQNIIHNLLFSLGPLCGSGSGVGSEQESGGVTQCGQSSERR